MTSTTDKIERQILLKAPRARVWQALSDAEQFGDWFGAAMQGQRFVPGQRARGQVTHPGHEHMTLDVLIERMEPERLLAFRWVPSADENPENPEAEVQTLVEFSLKDADGGTLLTLTESGFDRVPEARRLEVFRRNSGGWDFQMKNIEKHVAA